MKHPDQPLVPRDDFALPRPAADPALLTTLGHDLRAAVADIIGGLRLIDQRDLGPRVQLQLERIRSSGEALSRLLEEGLAVMLGEDEVDAAHPANIQISRFLYDLEMRWSGRAEQNGLTLSVTVGRDVPPVVTLDRIALDRILSNTLSNAIKYTDTGAVSLGVSVLADGALEFVVTDTGPGFSQAALSRLFEYEGRPDGAAKPGNGLGLHISRDMAGRLGGAIAVRNVQGGGAEVVLRLPASAWRASAPEPSVVLPDLSQVKVLLAEDTPTNQVLISRMLAQMGAEVEVAENGVEALHWLEREDFDIALIDIEMPRLSGIDVIRALRSQNRLHAAMPIVAVTAYVLRSHREAIYAAGADAILPKPIDGIDALGKAIRAALDRRAARAEAVPAVPACTEVVDHSRLAHLLEIAGADSAAELLNRLSSDLRRAERGLQAGLATADRATIRAETHVLIALAGAVGAVGLQKLAEALNTSAHRDDDPGRDALGRAALSLVDRLIAVVATERARLEVVS